MNKKLITVVGFFIMATTMINIINPSSKIELVETDEIEKIVKEEKIELTLTNTLIEITEGEEFDLLSVVDSKHNVTVNYGSTKDLEPGSYEIKYYANVGGRNITKSATLIVHEKIKEEAIKNNVVLLSNNYFYAPVKKHTNPTIILSNDNSYTIERGTALPTYYANAIDCDNNPLDVVINSNIDINEVGLYYVTFSTVDSLGYETTITKEVSVIDTTKPIVEINNSSDSLWTNEDVNITLSSNEDVTYYVSYDQENYEKLESNTLEFYESTETIVSIVAVDNYNNVSDVYETYVRIDKDAPTVEDNQTIEVDDLENFKLTDYIEASDINGVNMTRGEIVENVDGSYTLNVNVFDNLGNSTNTNVIVNVNVNINVN